MKRKMDRDMEVAEITSNDADLRKGLKEAKQLQGLDRKLSTAKRQARRVEQIQEGHAPAGDFITARANLEQKVEARVWREHLRRLQLQLLSSRKDAYHLKMRSARVMKAFHEGKKNLSEEDVQRADAKADMAVDNAKSADMAMRAALGKGSPGDIAFEPKRFASSVNRLSNIASSSPTKEQSLGDPPELSRGAVQKLATKTAVRAEGALNDALLDDSSFDKAATAAKVALAYEQTADKMDAHKVMSAKKKLKAAKEAANHAMVDAIQTGTNSAYMQLRRAMAQRKHDEGVLNGLKMKQDLNKRLKGVREVEQDPTVMVTTRFSKDADATYYRDMKTAERAYQHAADSASESDISSAGALVNREEKSAKKSKEASLELVNLQTTVAAKHVADAQKQAEEAIKAEHEGKEDEIIARRHAWSAVTAKEAAQVASEHASDGLRDANEKLADLEATSHEKGERYRHLRSETEVARRQSVGAAAIAQASLDKKKRRESTLARIRKQTAQGVASELRRLEIEVGMLEKTGHRKQADIAIADSNIRHEKRFLARESKRELDDQVANAKKESTKSLAEAMTKLVKGEAAKLHEAISAKGDTKSHFDMHDKQLDAKLAALRSKAMVDVRQKLEELPDQTVGKNKKEQRNDQTQKELKTMFKQVSKFQAANNEREKRARDADYVVHNTHKAARRLKIMQNFGDKPLAVAEAELQKIIKVEKLEKGKLANNTFAGQENKKAAAIETKFTNAGRAIAVAKQAMEDASSQSDLKRARDKMEAAKMLMDKAKEAKIAAKKARLDKEMEKVNQAAARKRSKLQQAVDATEKALHSLQKSDLQKAKTKVLEAQIRHDRWTLQQMQEEVDQSVETEHHTKHRFEELQERLETAQFEYTKAKRVSELEKGVAEHAKESARQSHRRYKTSVQVTHLADEHYRESKQELRTLARDSAQSESVLRAKRADLKFAEEAEQDAILAGRDHSDEPDR